MTSHNALSTNQLESFGRNGFIVLPNLLHATDMTMLKEAALQIVADFDISRHRSVFSTTDRDRSRDDYFFASAEAVHCFLEAEALDEAGQLIKAPHLAINKIGHALHDLNPTFRRFCDLQIFADLMQELGYLRFDLPDYAASSAV